MKRFSILLIISIFIISTSFEKKANKKNSIRFLEEDEDEETDLNMTSFEPPEKKSAPKPILLGFTSKYSDNEKKYLKEIILFFKNIKGNVFQDYIYFMVNYIPKKRRRRLEEKNIEHKALKGILNKTTLNEDIVEYNAENEYDDMKDFNLEKNIQFLDRDYSNLKYVEEKLGELDENAIDIMFTQDFSLSSTEQNFNKGSFLFFIASDIIQLQNRRIKIIGQFSSDYDPDKHGLLKKTIEFICVKCFPENVRIEAYFEKNKNTENYSLTFYLSSIIKINLEGAYSDLIFYEKNLRNLQTNNNKRLFLSEGEEQTLAIDYVPIYSNVKTKKSEGGLSAGAIVGIVVACIIVLIFASVISIYCANKKKVLPNSSAIQFYNSSFSLNEK